MKLLLAGLGSFGIGWYRRIKADPRGLAVAVVDPGPAAVSRRLDPDDLFYPDFATALRQEQPDLVDLAMNG